jgi:hypothetical protein
VLKSRIVSRVVVALVSWVIAQLPTGAPTPALVALEEDFPPPATHSVVVITG